MKRIKEKSFGIIPVFKDSNNNLFFCLVRHQQGHWGFPKGHHDVGESEEKTAKRELKEETGIDIINLLNDQFFFEKYSFKKDGFHHYKSVKYFLGFVPSTGATTQKNFKKEIPELRWVTYGEAKRIITFPEAKEVLNQVSDFLLQYSHE